MAGAPGEPDVHDVRAADLRPGEFSQLTSPSLFGSGAVVIVRAAQDAGKDVAGELTRYAAAPAADVVVAITHAGGAKGKALLAGLVKAGAAQVRCAPVKRFAERLDFLRAELRRAGRKADDGGLRALLDAVGNDLRELAAACSQLAADTDGVISTAVVTKYYRGRAEATGFTVADRAVEGKLAESLEQLRWALATGVSPVLIVSALAQGVRGLGRVGSAPRGLSADALAGELGHAAVEDRPGPAAAARLDAGRGSPRAPRGGRRRRSGQGRGRQRRVLAGTGYNDDCGRPAAGQRPGSRRAAALFS